jgi:DNA-binding transcriptional LysR family regulator
VALRFDELLDDEQIRRLTEGQLDVGFFRAPVVGNAALAAEDLLDEPYAAVLPAEHPLAGLALVDLGQPREETWILWPREDAAETYDDVIVACRRAGFSPRTLHAGGRPLTILGLVAAGLGISLLAASYTWIGREGVVFLPMRGVPPTRLRIACRADATSPALMRFLEMAREQRATYGHGSSLLNA